MCDKNEVGDVLVLLALYIRAVIRDVSPDTVVDLLVTLSDSLVESVTGVADTDGDDVASAESVTEAVLDGEESCRHTHPSKDVLATPVYDRSSQVARKKKLTATAGP